MLEYCYSKLDPVSSKEKVEKLKATFYMLYDEYKRRIVASSSGAPSSQVREFDTLGGVDGKYRQRGLDLGPFDFSDYKNYKRRGATSDMKSPLDKYLEDDEEDENKDINVLEITLCFPFYF